MITTDETLIDPAEVPRRIPPDRRGRRVHPQTVRRWMRAGFGPKKVKLESIKVGNRRVTSAEALDRFVRRLNAEAN